MSAILVTGSSGQVGSYLVDALRADARPVVGLDRRPSRWTDRVEDVRDLREAGGASVVVHLAAHVSVPGSVENPRRDAADNVDGVLAVLEAARRSDARVVFTSSVAVYGEPRRVPVEEAAPLLPASPYGLSKRVGEDYLALYRRLYGLPTVVLRPANIFSARQDPDSPYSGVITRFSRALARGEAPRVCGDGRQTRDFVHVTDVVQAIRIALDSPAAVGGTFNVGTGRATRVGELAERMASLDGRGIRPASAPPRPGDVRHSVLDVRRLRRLGYRPATDLGRNLPEILEGPARRRPPGRGVYAAQASS